MFCNANKLLLHTTKLQTHTAKNFKHFKDSQNWTQKQQGLLVTLNRQREGGLNLTLHTTKAERVKSPWISTRNSTESSSEIQLYVPECDGSADWRTKVLTLSSDWMSIPEFEKSCVPSLYQPTWAVGSESVQCSTTGQPASTDLTFSASGSAENPTGGATDMFKCVLRSVWLHYGYAKAVQPYQCKKTDQDSSSNIKQVLYHKRRK